jgi:protein-tyrosine-phosphatase
MQGVIPTFNFSSLAFDNFYLIDNVFIARNSCLINEYGGCSLVVKRTVVVRVTGVRFSPSAYLPSLQEGINKSGEPNTRAEFVSLRNLLIPKNQKFIISESPSAYLPSLQDGINKSGEPNTQAEFVSLRNLLIPKDQKFIISESPSAFPTLKKMVMKILFVCKNNRFRSRIATEYFNKINKNKKVKGSGAGVVVGAPLTNFQLKVAKDAEVNIRGKPRGLSSKLLMEQDIIVIVADNVPSLIFKDREYKAKIIRWDIKDVYDNDEKKILKTIEKIKKKVEGLVKKLEDKK